jgi:transposase InsO family protein
LWTSPIPSTSGYCHYLIAVDDFTHFFWSFPLRKKFEVYATFVAFHALITTQFQLPVLSLQCDNGTEFTNSKLDHFCTTHVILFRFSCPYTSQQNGKAERAIRTTNDVIRTLLFKARCHLPYGPKRYTQPPIYSIFDPPPPTQTPRRTSLYLDDTALPGPACLWLSLLCQHILYGQK